jgi:hypothetical protein
MASTRKSQTLERAAEAHFFIRPLLINALKGNLLTDAARAALGANHVSYYDFWQASLRDKFEDMTTMIQLGAAVEEVLRDTYMLAKGHANGAALRSDPLYSRGVFQRIMPWQTNAGSASHLLQSVGIDLSSVAKVHAAREAMLHRHLYAHNIGVIDDQYLDDWKQLTGEDLTPAVSSLGYPTKDCYWFRPLQAITTYIDELRKFVANLP